VYIYTRTSLFRASLIAGLMGVVGRGGVASVECCGGDRGWGVGEEWFVEDILGVLRGLFRDGIAGVECCGGGEGWCVGEDWSVAHILGVLRGLCGKSVLHSLGACVCGGRRGEGSVCV